MSVGVELAKEGVWVGGVKFLKTEHANSKQVKIEERIKR